MSKLLLQDDFFAALGLVEERVRKIEERNATIATTGGGGTGLTTGSVLDVHVASNAGIQLTKLSQDPRARSTHTGTQTASTISNFDTQVQTSRLDQMAAPTAGVNLNSQKITSLGAPTVGTDATTKTYVDAGDTAAKDRANHTGTQLAATISNFDTQVRTSRLDQMAAPTAAVAMNGQRITGLAEPTASQDASTKAYTDERAGSTAVLDGVPIGTIAPYAGATAPDDWLICDGAALSRTLYADLFAVISTAYGAGDGSTTFNLPDMRGRVPVGSGTGTGLTNRVRGTIGGSESHLLTSSESGQKAVTTASNNVDHTHQPQPYLSDRGGAHWAYATTGGVSIQLAQANTGGQSTNHQHTIAAADASAPHPNMQPWVATTYIIKAQERAPEGVLAAVEAAPIGTVAPYAGATAPTEDWLLCDGAAVSRTTYGELFTLLGTTYGAGDGTTTFNVPDMRGRVAVGAGTGTATDATEKTLGAKAGTENHTLTTGEMPSHAHRLPSNYVSDYAAGGNLGTAGNYNRNQQAYTDSTGGGAAHPNMQPYLVTNYIIRAKAAKAEKYSVIGDLAPIGSVTAFAGTVVPDDWVLCDGASYLRADYPELFAVIGTTFGSADATHFNLPDLRGRVVVGLGTHTDVDSLADNDGLPVASRKVKHRHGRGTLAVGANTGTIWTNTGTDGGSPTGVGRNFGAETHTHTLSGEIGDTTGPLDAPAHQVLYYIIKARMTAATSRTGNSSKSQLNITGDGVAKDFTMYHTLVLAANEPFIAQVWEADSGGNPVRQAEADIEYVDFQRLRVAFGTAPDSGSRFLVTVVG